MEDKKKARSYGDQAIEELFSKLKIEEAPGRERPYSLRSRKPRGAKENGAGYIRKKHKETHKKKREIKKQGKENSRKSSNPILSVKLPKIKVEKDDGSIEQYLTHSISIKTELYPFNLPYNPGDESQHSRAEYLSDIKPPLNYFFQSLSLLHEDAEHRRQIDTLGCQLEQSHLTTPSSTGELNPSCRLTEKKIYSEEDLFSFMNICRIVGKTGCKFIMAEYNWSEKHLRLVPGLNILAICTNFDCTKYLEGVVCPRGWFPERKGYCPLDGEVFNATCPLCKISITPDNSLGFGFYNCDFQLTYKLHKQPKHTTEIMKKENTIYFGKCKPAKETIDILQVRMSV